MKRLLIVVLFTFLFLGCGNPNSSSDQNASPKPQTKSDKFDPMQGYTTSTEAKPKYNKFPGFYDPKTQNNSNKKQPASELPEHR